MVGRVDAGAWLSLGASLVAGAGSVWLGWFLLAWLDWLSVGLPLLLALLVGLPGAVHTALGLRVPRPAWAMAAAPFSVLTFALPFAWENRGSDIRPPEEVPFSEAFTLAAVVAVFAGAFMAGCVALGAGLRQRRARRAVPPASAPGRPPHP